MTVFDKFQLYFTVLSAANFNCHDHVAFFNNFSFPNGLNVIHRIFKVKDDIFQVT